MNYLETLDKITAHRTLTREQAVTLTFHAESFGSQSWNGVRVEATETGTCGYTYSVTVE